jgi:hypothetical protein
MQGTGGGVVLSVELEYGRRPTCNIRSSGVFSETDEAPSPDESRGFGLVLDHRDQVCAVHRQGEGRIVCVKQPKRSVGGTVAFISDRLRT